MLQYELLFTNDDETDIAVPCYFHDEYYGMRDEQNRIRFVNVLKNDFMRTSARLILRTERVLADAIRDDLAIITQNHGPLTLVGVPRSKRESSYPWEMMGLKRALRRAVGANPMLSDGLDYIVRHTDTLCSHLDRCGYGGEGEGPRPGLILDTCHLSEEIRGKDILLVDDIYTPTCGIDEDAISTLFDQGANSVVFYAIGYTVRRYRYQHCA